MGTRHSCPCPPSCPYHMLPTAPSTPRSPSPPTAAPFSSAGAQQGAGGHRGSWPHSETVTNLPEGQWSAGPGLPPLPSGQVEGRAEPCPGRDATATPPGWQGQGRHRRATPTPAQQPRAPRGALDRALLLGDEQASCSTQHGPEQWDPARPLLQSECPWCPGSSRRGPSAQNPLAPLLWPCHQPGRLARAVHPLVPCHGHPLVPTLQGKEGCPEIFASYF